MLWIGACSESWSVLLRLFPIPSVTILPQLPWNISQLPRFTTSGNANSSSSPGAWVLIGEIFPLPIRSRGVALSTASNWLWNCIIAVITPYMVGSDKGDANLGSKVFFVWGSLCTACFVYSYLLIPETKGLSLEQVDRMLEETTPRNSAKWVPHSTFAADVGITEKGTLAPEIIEKVAHHQAEHTNKADETSAV